MMKKNQNEIISTDDLIEYKTIIDDKQELEKTKLKTSILRQETQKEWTILSNLDTYLEIPLFVRLKLTSKEVLFDEWDTDRNLYIVTKGHISIEKYTSSEKKKSKQLSVLKPGDFFWEWSLAGNTKKDVIARSIWDTEIIALKWEEWLNELIEKYPKLWKELLIEIINITNRRLLDSNMQVTANYEINMEINRIWEINRKSIFNLIERFRIIINCDYILYLEKHNIVENVLVLRYDTRYPSKMLDTIFEKKGAFLDLDELHDRANIWKTDVIIVNKVNIWDDVLGYIVLGRKNWLFSDNEKKITKSVSNSMAWVIKQFLNRREQWDRTYLWKH